eukprot:GEMP01099908.1.p1 GENE.GEMP01099908.1~~GEMP01099908.1.p1  ORF type:complete len:136 (-),score=10.72 GEMP01099908.1:122-529(-)
MTTKNTPNEMRATHINGNNKKRRFGAYNNKNPLFYTLTLLRHTTQHNKKYVKNRMTKHTHSEYGKNKYSVKMQKKTKRRFGAYQIEYPGEKAAPTLSIFLLLWRKIQLFYTPGSAKIQKKTKKEVREHYLFWYLS